VTSDETLSKPFEKTSRQGGKCRPVTRHSSLITLLVTLALAGCSTQPAIEESNYLTYNHPFTDAAAESARQNAEKNCAERKQAAVRTRSVCSLKECTTHYQCVDKAAQ
jgi:hypothetical protein